MPTKTPISTLTYPPRTLSVEYTKLGRNSANGKSVTSVQKMVGHQSRICWHRPHIQDQKILQNVPRRCRCWRLHFGICLHEGHHGLRGLWVEQTGTHAVMNERKKGMRNGYIKPQVVNREVCGIVSKGTSTFCYLEDESMLKKGGIILVRWWWSRRF